ncbi:hypothetical protein [Streptomyces sp. Ncost-T10-10d]|uniref:hypothetical protein n=1 Tax=Streptomyces sp. Ncost-T10-10d TaxID=1839774 RepID=UPI00081EAA82|nr:hypothetical protein [Streptomyces sp. Ncost-T10-10d]SCF93519.1 hypothetical protein GA0115254_125921 [Streptomyces sp. Ncost-T10-10d]
MGLSISVGLLYDQARNDAEGLDHHRRSFARLGQALTAEGISWHEPEITDPPRAHTFSSGFPYGYLTHLRRILVLANLGEPVTPALAVSKRQYDHDCEKIRDETSMLASHLLCHADNAGYYVPVDFDDPLFLPDEAKVEGAGMVGSSRRLLAELSGIAASIGIDLDDKGVPSDPEGTGPAAGPAIDGPFETERFAWYELYQACLASITGGHAIVFH